ncbi:MAG: GIY-YIG nuclease family protein [Sphingobium sp.]
MIYFIQHGSCGPIKVGTSSNPGKRIGEIAANCPDPLVVLGIIAGDQPLEQRIHRHLLGHCHRGEWFKPSEFVRSFVNFAVSASPEAIEAELSRGANERRAHLAKLSDLGSAVPGAVAFGLTLAVKYAGIDAVSLQADLSQRKIRDVVCGKQTLTVSEFERLTTAFPEAGSLFVILCLSPVTDPKEVRANRATIEAARDALDDLLRKVVQAA